MRSPTVEASARRIFLCGGVKGIREAFFCLLILSAWGLETANSFVARWKARPLAA
jgi:hypothetical protein